MTSTTSIATRQLPFRHLALEALSHHGLLTTRQLHAIAAQRTGETANLGWCRAVLAEAAKRGIVDFVCLTRGREKSWFLTSAGCEAAGGHAKHFKMNKTIATGPTSAHLGVVNAVGIAATKAVGADGEISWRHEEPLPLGSGRYLRPDAVLSVLTQQGRDLIGGEWFVEADRGTESISILVDKLANYLSYRNYRPSIPGGRSHTPLHWRNRFRSWPRILFVFDCDRAQSRIQRLAAWASGDPRLEPHWNKLSVTAMAIEDLGLLGEPTALVTVPTLERRPWIELD